MEHETLEELRNEIDRLDSEILSLTGERFHISRKIGKVKKKWNLPVEDTTREEQLLTRNIKAAEGTNLSLAFVRDLTHLLLAYSREVQNTDSST